MDLDLIERLMRLLENSSVNELELTENGTRIRLSKTVAQVTQTSAASAASSSTESAARATASASAAGPREHIIVAGLPGTFYRSPMPGEAPFVEIGERVEDGRKLAIIEAMKMMNPVEADCTGRVTAIHLEDGAPVTAGMPLFTLETSA
ncbi:acetyl-CoA carboxylase biotin carboxyl carrier protein [Rhizobium herbae]|uniref:Biotin carboxyl carrier protein of acetyl-CoA carboxylase n=1 Tax=Rhizobium herbae TaxID=508661 RepID=A0ABS4EJL1_9HYPH|nr:acetyl-CoA carboxylase biotin carboxyl carrier protein [Rhizobium herbae]MBP1858134.1 acetyl-CoA carboxylase biotin carboxyl carrier protein [Rhizobium herbae]